MASHSFRLILIRFLLRNSNNSYFDICSSPIFDLLRRRVSFRPTNKNAQLMLALDPRRRAVHATVVCVDYSFFVCFFVSDDLSFATSQHVHFASPYTRTARRTTQTAAECLQQQYFRNPPTCLPSECVTYSSARVFLDVWLFQVLKRFLYLSCCQFAELSTDSRIRSCLHRCTRLVFTQVQTNV